MEKKNYKVDCLPSPTVHHFFTALFVWLFVFVFCTQEIPMQTTATVRACLLAEMYFNMNIPGMQCAHV